MDRRDALKKLGMGGMAVTGATLIVSSPAFAFNVTPVAPTVTVVTAASEKSSTFTMSQANPTCGGSTNGLPTRISNFGTSASRGTFSPASGSVALPPDTTATTLTLDTNAPKLTQGDTATVTIRTTFTCPYPGGDGTACRDYTFVYTYSDVAKNFELNGGAPGVENC